MPLARLGWKAFDSGLGANPIQVITFSTGKWTLVFLLLTLSITPLRKLTKQYWLIQYRRMIGLFAFFYALSALHHLHLAGPVLRPAQRLQRHLQAALHHGRIYCIRVDDPLSATSTQRAIRKLGKRWQTLHRLIYFSAIAGVIHFLWAVKLDKRVPEIYGAVLSVLLLYRLLVWCRGRLGTSKAVVPRNQAGTQRVVIEER